MIYVPTAGARFVTGLTRLLGPTLGCTTQIVYEFLLHVCTGFLLNTCFVGTGWTQELSHVCKGQRGYRYFRKKSANTSDSPEARRAKKKAAADDPEAEETAGCFVFTLRFFFFLFFWLRFRPIRWAWTINTRSLGEKGGVCAGEKSLRQTWTWPICKGLFDVVI